MLTNTIFSVTIYPYQTTTHERRYKNMKEAITKLENKGYFVENQFYGFGAELGANEYELSDRDGNTVIDHLSEAQVIQLSNIL